jgi:hypothetical protein
LSVQKDPGQPIDAEQNPASPNGAGVEILCKPPKPIMPTPMIYIENRSEAQPVSRGAKPNIEPQRVY